MNKENQSAAGLRRSAIAERIRIREEWSEIKGVCLAQLNGRQNNVLTKKQTNIKTATSVAKTNTDRTRKPSARNMQLTDNILCGVVALVEIGSESRALPLRAALAALGASVLPVWSPLVTHLVWSQGGCRATRARARALACRLVSPLWVESCAAAARRLPEQAFPAATRPSDLPSPRTLQTLLRRAEMENIPIADLLSDSSEENHKQLRLRISSETEQDTSVDTDTSRDMSHDTSHDTSNDSHVGAKTHEKSRPKSPPHSKAPPAKSRRQLFVNKEAEKAENRDSDESDENTRPKVIRPSYKPHAGMKKVKSGHLARRELARAERLARRLVAGRTPAMQPLREHIPRIVLTGMSRSERRVVWAAARALGGRVQRSVDRRTTHVLMGTFLHDTEFNKTFTGIPTLPSTAVSSENPRTLNALCGAVRGCRVLTAQWALDSKDNGKWLHHCGYEVPHLKKISEKARLERSAWGKTRSEYAYDVFCGMRVRLARDVPQRDAAAHLLRLCGAVVQLDDENCGGPTQTQVRPSQNGGRRDPMEYYVTQRPECEYDVRVSCDEGDVTAKWVFDSVAAGRMRNTRRYLVMDGISAQMAMLGC